MIGGMFHTYQTKEDIRRIITETLVEFRRPVSNHDIAYRVFDRALIDGTRASVFITIEVETESMVADQLLRDGHVVEDAAVVRVFEPYDTLAAIAVLTSE